MEMQRRRTSGSSGASGGTSRGATRTSRSSDAYRGDASPDARHDSNFRRLAAQLGLSRQLQRIADDQDDDDDEAYEGQGVYADEYAAEDDARYDEAGGDAPLTPLRSDYSASESLSSDLSLPRSFGNYDVMTQRRSPFDDELQRATQRNTERNAAIAASGGSVPSTVTSGVPSTANDLMRKFYEAQVEKIRQQLAVVTQAHHENEAMLVEEQQQWSARLKELESSLKNEREAAKSQQIMMETQIQQLKMRLQMEKSHLSDLQISEALAEQLARQDEEDLSVKEFIQLQVHRKLRQTDGELTTLRKELDTLQQLCASYKTHATSASQEVTQVARVAEAKELRLQHELELSEASRAELEKEIGSLCGQIDVLKDAQAKAEAQNALRRPPSVDVYTENEKLQSELRLAQDKLHDSSHRSDEMRKQIDELQQKVTLLRADKAFLQDAKRQLEDHEMRLMAKNKELQNRADLAAAAQLSDANELHKTQEESRIHFEKQLAVEIDKFMEMSKREIETIRGNSQMVYERENRLLKEARDDALKQIDMLQTRLQSVQTALEEKVLDSTRLESTHTTTLASLRNDLKMKHFEMNQLGMSLEERSLELRGAKLEIEMLQQKLEAHKEEFARLESTSTTRITQLEASLETERRRLEEYERLEIDLDDAVLQTGAIGVGGVEAADRFLPSKKMDEVMATFGAIPTSTKRRFHQSVQLAQRVVKYQRESHELQRQLTVYQDEKRQLEAQASDLKRQLANFHQPQSYLIDKISRKDEEIKQLRRQNDHIQGQLQELRIEYQRTNAAKMALQGQLQQVLSRRQELDGLKMTVQLLRKKLSTTADEDVGSAPVKAAPSPYVKNPPSPHVLSQMVRPPTPQTTSSTHNDGDPTGGVDASSPPKWYIKLRS